MGGALFFKKEGRQSCDSYLLLLLFLMGDLKKKSVLTGIIQQKGSN